MFAYYLCEKYYKPIIAQYYVADCGSWVPRLTLLDLRTNRTDERALGVELVCVLWTYCVSVCIISVSFPIQSPHP